MNKSKSKTVKKLPSKNYKVVGIGILTWFKAERVSDRYGSCYLMRDGIDSNTTLPPPHHAAMWFPKSGQPGTLFARVVEPRDSTHIGDFFRGLFPRKPKAGDIYKLGTGSCFLNTLGSEGNEDIAIGVKPDDDRQSDWLNPRCLYDIHESLVELTWHPKSK